MCKRKDSLASMELLLYSTAMVAGVWEGREDLGLNEGDEWN